MSRSNILWGLGGAIVGSIATYFVMEFIYEKEMAEFYNEAVVSGPPGPMGPKGEPGKVIALRDADMYNPSDDTVVSFETHVVGEEQHADEEEATVMEAIYAEEHSEDGDAEFTVTAVEDEEEEGEGDRQDETDSEDKVIYLIDVAEVNPGRRIIARFNHEDCSVDISSVMSVKSHHLEEHLEEDEIEELIGLEAYNILMNAEPVKKERMIGVRNAVINLDFAISY